MGSVWEERLAPLCSLEEVRPVGKPRLWGKQALQRKSACQRPSRRRCHPTLGAALCHLLLSSEARADPCCPAGQSLAPGVQTGVQGTSLGVLARHEMMTPCSAVMWLYCDLLYLSAGHSGCCLYFFSLAVTINAATNPGRASVFVCISGCDSERLFPRITL